MMSSYENHAKRVLCAVSDCLNNTYINNTFIYFNVLMKHQFHWTIPTSHAGPRMTVIEESHISSKAKP